MRHLYVFPRRLGAVFLVLFAAFGVPGQDTTTLRVMTANLTSGNAQKYDTPGLDILMGLKPDIVAIQEFKYNNSTPADIRSMIDTTFGANFNYFRETNAAYSIPNGVISRYPIIDAGSWDDTLIPDRGFAWARIALPGTNELYVVSVHLYSSGTAADRNAEATAIKSLVQATFPAGAWVIVAGDFNTSSRGEPAIGTFTTFLSDQPIPTDAESGGDPDTNAGRSSPYDYVLPSFSLTNSQIPVVFSSHTFSNGLVFDSRVYLPLSDVTPVATGDSGATAMQHMAVVKDFTIAASGTNVFAPVIVGQPQSQTIPLGSNATFTVSVTGTQPLAFQWRRDTASIPDATNAAYSLTNVTASDDADYSVVVSNSAGVAISSNATLTVNSAPMIWSQPQSQSISAGQTATFAVTASGAAPLRYQWRFYSTNLASATGSSLARPNADATNAGPYTVVVTNSFGGATSAIATLSVRYAQPTVIAQWNFNSPTADANVGTGTTAPSLGTGTASLLNGASATFATGDLASDPAGNTDNSGWNTSSYPAANASNKTAGAQFKASTAGRQNITVSWSERVSNSGSKYARLQYTTNGTTFQDFPTAVAANATATFESKTNDLSAVIAVNNNSNFAVRIVAEFENTAANTLNTNYVGVGGAYGTGGTIRFDMVTISGSPISVTNGPPSPASLSAPVYNTSGQFQFSLAGDPGSSYVVQATTNLASGNWLPLRTNLSPFNFTDTNASSFTQRFYRALSLP